MPVTSHTYPSRIDAGFAVLILVPVAVGLYVIDEMPSSFRGRTLALCCMSGVLLFALWVLFTTRYTIDATSLTVRSGPFRWRIPLGEIRSVTPTRDVRSGPALSLDRLRIEYRGAPPLLLSPREREKFLADLATRGVSVQSPVLR